MAKFRQLRIDYPHQPRVRPLSSIAKLVHLFTMLPHVTGIVRQAPKQLARQCGPDVSEARVLEAIAELTAGEDPHAVWWEDEDVLWLVDAYDEQGSEAPSLRKHAAQWAQSFGPEIYAQFCARYPWADSAQDWTRKKRAPAGPTQLELEPELEGERELELELERTPSHGVSVGVSDRVSDRVSDTVSGVQVPLSPTPDPVEARPKNGDSRTQRRSPQPDPPSRRHGDALPGKKPNASFLIAKAIERITSVSSPSSGPVLNAVEAISFNRATLDQVLDVYQAIAEAPQPTRPNDLGALWWKANTADTLRAWLPPSPEDLERRDRRKAAADEDKRRAAKDRQRQMEEDAGKSADAVRAVGSFLNGGEPS